jgi:hypothetical protein
MPATIIPFTSATTLFEQAEKRGSGLTTERTKKTAVKSVDEPETRLWKVCARQSSRSQVMIDLIILTVFVFIALALVTCFVEVQQRTDLLEQAAVEAIQR